MRDEKRSAGRLTGVPGELASQGVAQQAISTRSRSTKIAGVGLAFVAYVVLYLPADRVFGAAAGMLGMLPVIAAGWVLGAAAGVVSGLLCLPLNAVLLAIGGRPAAEVLASPGALGIIALTVIGAVVGRLHDLGERLEGELAQRRLSEAALGESERRYRAVVETAIVGISLADGDERLLYVNQAFADMLGHDLKDMVGTYLSEYMSPEEFSRARQESHLRRQGIRSHYEVTMRRKDGRACAALVSAAPFHRKDGTYEGALAVVIDVTALKEGQEAVLQANERHRNIFDGVQDAIFVESLSGEILDVNDRACEMFGWPREEFLTKTVSDLLPKGSEAVLPHLLGEGSLPEYPVETINLRAGGGVFPVEITTRLQTIAGQPVVLVVLRDITKRKRAEEALERSRLELVQSNKDLEQFSYGISHDLQEPLRMVTSYLELLERRYAERLGADAGEFIDFAVDGAKRMQRMIGSLLAFSRVGTRGKEFTPTAMEGVIEQAVSNLEIAIEESGAVVTHDPLPTLEVDEAQMVQVIQNLIANAIKFRGERPPEVHVSAERQQGVWLFSVRDDGIGIPPDQIERVFEVFVRLHGRGEYPGEGIGLAICRRIVERHHGRIWAESNQGKGTIVRFSLRGEGTLAGG